MLVKQIKYNSKDYKEMVRLRNLILLKPLGLSHNKLELMKEIDDIHVGCFNKDKIIGTLVLTPVDKDTVKIRQVAVADKHQGKGVGTKLVRFAEKIAADHKFSKIIISARTAVLDFYIKLGYKTIGEEYVSKNTNIPHFKMIKNIT